MSPPTEHELAMLDVADAAFEASQNFRVPLRVPPNLRVPLRVSSAILDVIACRVQEISQNTCQPNLTLREVADVIAADPAGMHLSFAHALAMLCRGYPPINPTEWHARVVPTLSNIPSDRDIRATSYRVFVVQDVDALLVQQFCFIRWLASSDDAWSWFHQLHMQLHALYFAIGWNRTSPAAKAAFYYAAYAAQHPAHTRDLSHAEIVVRCEGPWRDAYRVWHSSSQELITAANRLLELYNLFGAAILLDPFWFVNNLVVCGSYLHRLYRDVATNWAAALHSCSSTAVHEANCNAIKIIVQVVGIIGDDCDLYQLKTFFFCYPPTCTGMD